MRKNCLIISIVCFAICLFSLCLMSCDVMAETMILKLNKSEITTGVGKDAVTTSAYVVDGKELQAVGKAGTDKGVDIILVNVDSKDADKVKADASFVAGSFLELAVKDPTLAKAVLDCEYDITVKEDGKDVIRQTRTKVSAAETLGVTKFTVKLPVQISGQPSELEYDAEGALHEVK